MKTIITSIDKGSSAYNLDESLLAYLEFIDIPPITTSATIIKHTLKQGILNNKPINFKLIKGVVNKFNLEWNSELYLLRLYIKSWHKNTYLKFCNIYSCDSFSPKIVDVLNNIFSCFLKNKHPMLCGINLYSIHKELDQKNLDDRKLIRAEKYKQLLLHPELRQ